MTDILLAAVLVAIVVLIGAVLALYRRLWRLMGSIECLCTNVDRLANRLPDRQA